MKTLIIFTITLTLLAACSKTETPTPAPTPTPIPVVTVKADIPADWKALKPFGDERLCAVSVAIGEKIYAGLGYSGSAYTVNNDWYEYNPATDTWTIKTPFPGVERANAVAFTINGKIYVGLGTNYNRSSKGDTYTDFYEYDPATDKWTKKANFAGIGRDQPAYFTIGNKGYVGTGNTDPFSAVSVVNDFYEYDPATDKWTEKAFFAGAGRCRAFGFSVNNKGYIGTGEDRNITKLTDVYEYDPTTNKWTMKVDFPVAVARATTFSFGNFGYVLGGITAITKASVYKFSPTDNTWTEVSTVAVADDTKKVRFYQIAAATKTKAYIGLGASGGSETHTKQKDFYEYVPK